MKKVSIDDIVGNIGAQEAALRQAEINAAHLGNEIPKSVEWFERVLSDAVNKVNNKLSHDQQISFKMNDSRKGSGSLERGRVRYQYTFANGKLTISFTNSRGSNSEDFMPTLAEEHPKGDQQNITIYWSHGGDKFRADELAPSLLNRFLEDKFRS